MIHYLQKQHIPEAAVWSGEVIGHSSFTLFLLDLELHLHMILLYFVMIRIFSNLLSLDLT